MLCAEICTEVDVLHYQTSDGRKSPSSAAADFKDVDSLELEIESGKVRGFRRGARSRVCPAAVYLLYQRFTRRVIFKVDYSE